MHIFKMSLARKKDLPINDLIEYAAFSVYYTETEIKINEN